MGRKGIEYWVTGVRGLVSAAFAAIFLVIPVGLLASIRPGVLAVGFTALGTICLILSVCPLPRVSKARTMARNLFLMAAVLLTAHVSGFLEPLYRRDGWLMLGLEMTVHPLQVSPGDILTYTMKTQTTDLRPALARRFVVEGVEYRGMLLYSFLPTHDGEGFSLAAVPTARVIPTAESQGESTTANTVVYAKLEVPVLNSVNWNWSTSYTEGWDVIGVITSDGQHNSNLDAGESLMLEYSVVVPSRHPAGTVSTVRAGLSYRDPQWATHYEHELRFSVDETVIVLLDQE